jgi:hypothetical protein
VRGDGGGGTDPGRDAVSGQDAAAPVDIRRDTPLAVDVPGGPDVVRRDVAGADTTPPPDTVTPPRDVVTNPDVPTATGSYGSPCRSAAECESGWCIQNTVAGRSECTKACGRDADCPAPHFCGGTARTVDLGLAADVCLESDAGGACGSCLVYDLNGGGGMCECTTPCSAAARCPGGFACSPVLADDGSIDVCIRIGGLCFMQMHEMCISNVCLSSEFGIDGVCSAACAATADCPAGWTCGASLLAPPGLDRVCLP